MNIERTLILENLHKGLPGVTRRRGEEHYEAALVCLTEQSHEPGVACDIKNLEETLAKLALAWSEPVTRQMMDSWNDLDEAAESGAVGIALLVMLELTQYTIIRRSKKGTGIDYWLGYMHASANLHENILKDCARLEVSGARRRQRDSDIRALVRNKMKQSERSDESRLPAYVIVVEFNKPVVYMVIREIG